MNIQNEICHLLRSFAQKLGVIRKNVWDIVTTISECQTMKASEPILMSVSRNSVQNTLVIRGKLGITFVVILRLRNCHLKVNLPFTKVIEAICSRSNV